MTSPGGSEHPFPRARQGHLSQCVGRGIYEHFSAFLFLRLLVYQAGIPQSQTLSDLPTCIPPPPFTAGHLSHTRSQGVEVKRANMESLCDQNRIILRRGEQQSRPGGVTLTLHSSHTSYTAKDATVGITLAGGGGGVSKSCLTLVALWAVARQAPPSMEFSRQEYWNGLPFPSPGDLPNPGAEPTSLALQADFLPLSHQES